MAKPSSQAVVNRMNDDKDTLHSLQRALIKYQYGNPFTNNFSEQVVVRAITGYTGIDNASVQKMLAWYDDPNNNFLDRSVQDWLILIEDFLPSDNLLFDSNKTAFDAVTYPTLTLDAGELYYYDPTDITFIGTDPHAGKSYTKTVINATRIDIDFSGSDTFEGGTDSYAPYAFLEMPETTPDVFDRSDPLIWNEANLEYDYYESGNKRRWQVETLLIANEFLSSLNVTSWQVFCQTLGGGLKRVVGYEGVWDTETISKPLGFVDDSWGTGGTGTIIDNDSFSATDGTGLIVKSSFWSPNDVGKHFKLHLDLSNINSNDLQIRSSGNNVVYDGLTSNVYAAGTHIIRVYVLAASNIVFDNGGSGADTFTFQDKMVKEEIYSPETCAKILKAVKDTTSDPADYDLYINFDTSAVLNDAGTPCAIDEDMKTVHDISNDQTATQATVADQPALKEDATSKYAEILSGKELDLPASADTTAIINGESITLDSATVVTYTDMQKLSTPTTKLRTLIKSS